MKLFQTKLSKYIHFGIKKKEARVDATPSDRVMQSYWLPSGGCLLVAAFWWLPSGGCLLVAAFWYNNHFAYIY